MRKCRSIDSFDDPDLSDEDYGLQSSPDVPEPVKMFVIALIDPDTGEIVDELNAPRKAFDDLKILY